MSNSNQLERHSLPPLSLLPLFNGRGILVKTLSLSIADRTRDILEPERTGTTPPKLFFSREINKKKWNGPIFVAQVRASRYCLFFDYTTDRTKVFREEIQVKIQEMYLEEHITSRTFV
ncbi:hypothetical protein AVEN_126368-1 [Araneus ventricosus]|uniref:Uncharacterized protein n=1 Tax=Araneus ventricosus TaxID=182803 RepID=A0A4Y2FX24_ARAVE|nr:hypothetical protein AVEN_126368-1 [Araneus ventricosus]